MLPPLTSPLSIEETVLAVPRGVTPLLVLPVSVLRLPTRASLCFAQLDIQYLLDLVRCTYYTLLRVRGVGRQTVNAIVLALAEYNLALGMEIDWHPTRTEQDVLCEIWSTLLRFDMSPKRLKRFARTFHP